MAKPTMKLSESLTRKQLMHLQILIASAVPTAAVLVVGVVGAAQMSHMDGIFFILDFLVCATAVFFGERTIILRMQHAMNEQLNDLTTTCREFTKGNKERRVSVQGDDELATLASALNTLLDQQQATLRSAMAAKAETRVADEAATRRLDPPREDMELVNEQLEQLVDDLSPALDGDLRVVSYVAEDATEDSVAVVADLCNALVEKLVQFTRWTLYASDKVINTSRNVFERSLELAQKTEGQMEYLSQMTGAVESLVAFIQRMGSALQLSVDMAQEAYNYIQEHKGAGKSRQVNEFFEQITANTKKQLQLLEEILQSTHNTTTIAESAIGDLYTFAQQFHQSSTAVIKTAESINAIVTIAEDWRNAADALYLPEEDTEQISAEEDNHVNHDRLQRTR